MGDRSSAMQASCDTAGLNMEDTEIEEVFVDEVFGELLLARGAKLAPPKQTATFGTDVCQDYGHFLMDVGNGTSQADREGWVFFGDQEIRRLSTIAEERGWALPQSYLAETYLAFAECAAHQRMLLFRTLRPSLSTDMIYQLHGTELFPVAHRFEDFVEQLDAQLATT